METKNILIILWIVFMATINSAVWTFVIEDSTVSYTLGALFVVGLIEINKR